MSISIIISTSNSIIISTSIIISIRMSISISNSIIDISVGKCIRISNIIRISILELTLA
jgi:hypothetical protein